MSRVFAESSNTCLQSGLLQLMINNKSGLHTAPFLPTLAYLAALPANNSPCSLRLLASCPHPPPQILPSNLQQLLFIALDNRH